MTEKNIWFWQWLEGCFRNTSAYDPISPISMLIGTKTPTWLPVPFCRTVKLLFFSSSASFQCLNFQLLPFYNHLTVHAQTFPTPIQVYYFSCPALLPLHTSTYPNFFFLYLTLASLLHVPPVFASCSSVKVLGNSGLSSALGQPFTKIWFPASFMISLPLASAFSLLSVFWKLCPLFRISPFSLTDVNFCRAGKTHVLLAGVLSARVPLAASDSNYRESPHQSF